VVGNLDWNPAVFSYKMETEVTISLSMIATVRRL
jgi:hypothetical protein